MRFGQVIVAYFLIGAIMWGGGVIDFDDAGVGQMFVDYSGTDFNINQDTVDSLQNSGGPIREAAGSFVGGLLAILQFVNLVMSFLVWPITVLQTVGAPPRVVYTLGGVYVVALFGAFLRIIRGSA